MGRSRNIKPGFFLNEELAAIGEAAQVLFAGLWCMSDRDGRLKDRPGAIKAQCLPFSSADVDSLLQKLSEGNDPFITRYEVDGARYIQICNWHRHQSPHHTEKASEIPAIKRKTVKTRCKHGDKTLEQPAALESVNQTISESVNQESVNQESVSGRGGGEKPFDRWWSVWPKKVGRRAAEKAYDKAVKFLRLRPPEAGPGADDPHGFLLDRVTAFARSPRGRGDPQYTPHPSKWLNEGRYDDDPRIWQRGDDRHDPRGTISAAEQYLRGSNGH